VQAGRLVGSGLVLGAAVALEYIQIIGAVLIFLYAWNRVGTRRVWLVGVGGLPLGLLIMLYHYAAFGGPFAFPYPHAIPILAVDHGQKMIEVDHPTWERLLAVVFGVRRGLFVYAPVLLLLAVLMVRDALVARRHLAESVLGLAFLACYPLFQASSPLVSITWGIGPRYAGGLVPFVMLGVLLLRSPIELKSFYSLAWLSVLINWLCVQRDIEPQHHPFPLADALVACLHSGPTANFLEMALSFAGISNPLVTWPVGLAAYGSLATIILWIWHKTKTEDTATLRSQEEDRHPARESV
jgi:hypothetical protein